VSNMYNLFLSHSWTYSDAYDKLVELLDDAKYFSYKNYSVPKDDPVHNAKNDKELTDAIEKQIRPASVVLILAGVYSTYSKWIKKEIEIAKSYGKPIIAIEPWAAERTSKIVKDNADIVVKWQTSSIVDAIKNLT
jgi:hypothetical protein